MAERRQHARQRLSTVAYVSLGEGGGGILVDVSQGGFGAQAIGHFVAHQLIRCYLDLTGSPYRLECGGRIAWINPEGRLGFEFLGLSDAACIQLRHWLSVIGEEVNPVEPTRPPTASLQPPRTAVTKPQASAADTYPGARASAAPQLPRRETTRPGGPALPAALQGPFPLTAENIEARAPSDYGVYVLGDYLANGSFEALRVERSADVKRSLGQHLGQYRYFQSVIASSEIDAWDRECQLYHLHRPRHNSVHPVRRENWDCPVCHGFS